MATITTDEYRAAVKRWAEFARGRMSKAVEDIELSSITTEQAACIRLAMQTQIETAIQLAVDAANELR